MKKASTKKTRAGSAVLEPNGGNGAAGARNGDKYQRILRAAIEVIAENGFFNARVSEIAARAGVADGTIYLYFKNKEQILMEAIDFAFDTFLTRASAELVDIKDPRKKLRHLARLHFEMLGADRNVAAVFQTELRQSLKFLAQFSQRRLVQYFDVIRGIVREGQKQGVFRKEISDKIAANCFFGAVDEMVTSWLLSDRDYNLANATDVVMDVILNGMESPPANADPNTQ